MAFPAATVIDSAVVWTLIPHPHIPGKRIKHVVGVRLDMADGSWWFRSRGSRRNAPTWTKHEPGLPQFHKSGSPTGEIGPERVTRFGTDDQMHRAMGHCRQLMEALSTGLALAA